MSPSLPAARTEDLVQFLLDHGFVPGRRGVARTDFTHSGGAVITVPTGAEEIPTAFVHALIQQLSMMDMPGVDELRRMLLG